MVDPVTAIAGATAAFNALKKGIQVGRDLQDMGGQLSQWAGAVADLDFADRQCQKPPWYKTLGGGIEAQAMEIFAAKQKAESMRKELKDFISVMYGPSKWQEILEIEAKLRKQKKEQEYRKAEMIEAIITWGISGVILLVGVGTLGFILYMVA